MLGRSIGSLPVDRFFVVAGGADVRYSKGISGRTEGARKVIQCRNGERHGHATAAEARACWTTHGRYAYPSASGDRVAVMPVPALTDRIAPVGAYRRDGRVYRVVQRPNGHRRAEVLHGGAYVYAAGMVFRLTAADRMTLAEEIEYGQTEKRCVRCGTELTLPASVAAGIGPVCITKW